jgi:NADPH-dependent ferric siderophore reductase
MAREFTYHQATVLSLTTLTPHMRRLVVGGAGAAGWRTSGVPDEALLLVFPRPGAGVVMPDTITEGDPYERTRWYTVRRYDAVRDELTVDIAGHDIGLSARWARSVETGDPIGVSCVHSWWDRPDDAAWQVLIGDLTALPTISRVLEDHSAGVPTQVLVEVPDAADEQQLVAPPGVQVTWVHTPADEPSQLEAMARSLVLPEGPGYVYAAGETSATRAVRKHLRHERGLPGSSYSVVGYWRTRSEEWLERYAAAQEVLGLEELYARFEADGADKEALNDEVDRRLIAAGL